MKYLIIFILGIQTAYGYNTEQILQFQDVATNKKVDSSERLKALSFLVFSGNASKDDIRLSRDVLQWAESQSDQNLKILGWMNSVLLCQRSWKEKEYTNLMNQTNYNEEQKNGVKQMFYTIRKKISC